MNPDDDDAAGDDRGARSIRAAEIALGLAPDRERALAADPALRDAVEAWEADFAALVDELPDVPPRGSVWTGIHAAMAPVRGAPPRASAHPALRGLLDSLGLWRAAAAAGWAFAVAALVLVPNGRPEVAPPTAPPLLVSSLLPRDGGPLYVVAYDPGHARLVVVPAVPVRESGRVAQLWLVPNDTDEPIALAPVGTERPQIVALTAEQTRHVVEGAGLVITLEPDASPNPASAQGPVLAHGKLGRV